MTSVQPYSRNIPFTTERPRHQVGWKPNRALLILHLAQEPLLVFRGLGLAGIFDDAGGRRSAQAFPGDGPDLFSGAKNAPALAGHGFLRGVNWRKVMGIEPIAAPEEQPSALKAGRVTRPDHLPEADYSIVNSPQMSLGNPWMGFRPALRDGPCSFRGESSTPRARFWPVRPAGRHGR